MKRLADASDAGEVCRDPSSLPIPLGRDLGVSFMYVCICYFQNKSKLLASNSYSIQLHA